jgi:DNA-binding response OmpR family regulator
MKPRDHARAGTSTAKVPALRRVLVVEDEIHTAQYVDEILRRMGIEVIGPVGTLRQAMILAETERLDAALLDVRLHPDVRLPYCDRAYPVADLLRRRKIPFWVMTVSAAEWIDRFPSDPVLLKPFREDQLESAVRRLLRSDSMDASARPRRVGRATRAAC